MILIEDKLISILRIAILSTGHFFVFLFHKIAYEKVYRMQI